MSTADECALGASYSANIDKSVKIDQDGPTNRRLINISSAIFAQAVRDRGDVRYRIKIIDDPSVNAFSLPGGYIYVYRGLYDKLGSDDDALAAVISHEVSHIAMRHAVKMISSSQDQGLIAALLGVVTRSSAAAQMGDAALSLDALHFSRQDEYDADRSGERYMYLAGYNAAGMVRTLRLVRSAEPGPGRSGGSFEQDHPGDVNRELRAIEQDRELIANHGEYLSQRYNANGDVVAAQKNGMDYPSLVKRTEMDFSTVPGSSEATK
jgi:predicted Zn-dependent protease